MSALTELQAGTPATAFSNLLTRTVLSVGMRRGFPPPDGGSWTTAAAADVAGEFLARERTPKVLEALALSAGNDQELAAQLQGIVRNFLRDRGRTTEIGRLVVRIRRALKDPRYQALPGDRFGLTGGPNEASAVPPDDLVAATAGLHVDFGNWTPLSKRRPPFATADSIHQLIDSVLGAAAGSVRPADIAHAIAPALQVFAANELVELDSGDPPAETVDDGAVDHIGLDVPDRARAIEIFELLTDREKIALGHWELGARELAPLIGLGHSRANDIKNNVIETLKEELDSEENGQSIAEGVMKFATIWVDDRTRSEDGTYGTA
jgi:hypothetical protein